jgi:adenylylsulfate kinase
MEENTGSNIHPIFDTQLQRSEKENLLRQRAGVFWLIGISGSGKSTLAKALEKALFERGYLTKSLDGDNLRSGLNKNLGFSDQDRVENIRRAAEVSRLFLDCGVITLCSLITPTEEIRKMSRNIIGEADYHEIYVNCSLEICEQRDVKGLYAKARRGEIANFTGINSVFEPPVNAVLELRTDLEEPSESLQKLLNFVLPKVKWKNS